MTRSLFYFFYFMCCIYQKNIFSHEYLYPVGTIIQDNTEKICVIHQKNMALTAWFWDPLTREAVKGLSMPYNAAGVCILPSKQEFSFIQNDAIKYKNINEKSARMLDLYGPYDFNTVRWLSNETCYFSAKYLNKMCLFQADKKNNVLCLTDSKSTSDYMYPQHAGNFLFYIKRNDEGKYAVCKIPYKHPFMEDEEDSFLKKSYLNMEKESVLYVHDNTNEHLGFLSINDDLEGFFISFLYEHNYSFLTFKLFYFSIKNNELETPISYLFSFSLPLFLIKEEINKKSLRLYESIIPLLPKYYNGSFYYSDGCNHISLYCYNKNQHKYYKISRNTINNIHFAPYIHNNVLYYGGAVTNDGLIKLIYNDITNNYYIKLHSQSI